MTATIALIKAHCDAHERSGRAQFSVAGIRLLLDHIASIESDLAEARCQRDDIGRAWDSADARAKAAEAELELFSDQSNNFQDRLVQTEAELANAKSELARVKKALGEALDALEGADDTLDRITQHDPKTPGLHFDSLAGLLESAVGIAGLRRDAIAPILASRSISQDGEERS